jgi:hypothetical protein
MVEVLVATLVAGIALSAVATAIGQAAILKQTQDENPSQAIMLATTIHTLAMQLPRETWDGSPATSGATLETLGDLTGAVFSPPIDLKRATRTALAGWSQEVSLREVGIDDPTTDAAVSGETQTLWEVSVTIKQGSEIEGSYVWWVVP